MTMGIMIICLNCCSDRNHFELKGLLVSVATCFVSPNCFEMSHSWEQPHRLRKQRRTEYPTHSWEDRARDADISDEEAESEQTIASRQLLDIILGLYLESVLSARVFCEVCHWAARAGIDYDDIAKHGLPPGQSTGNYQKHMNRTLGLDELQRSHYQVRAPCYPMG